MTKTDNSSAVDDSQSLMQVAKRSRMNYSAATKSVPGVSMLGLTTKIPRLLFADDALVVAETSDKLKSALNTITKWADMNEMQINNSKYGIICINPLTTDNFKIQNKITAIRLKTLQSVLISIGTYGGELFGMIGAGKNTALNRLRTEFGMNTINSNIPCLQKRAYIKWPILRTLIADLTKNTIQTDASTWVSGKARWLNKYTKKVKSGATKNTIAGRYDKNDKSKIYIFIKTHNMETASNWINLQLLYLEIKLGLQDIGKIRIGSLQSVAVIRKDAIGQFISRLYKLANLITNELLKEAQRGLVDKLLGGEYTSFLFELKLRKKINIPLSMELKTAKFMNGILVAQALIVDKIKCSSTFLN
ncbi:hypothetical protein BB561_002210 [Smittium simulii]|uniref:Reverse transcriptase domain-containing protein n=1 Tax=Smittium simulii TaxID=133385 RepID=A0A2T9YR71_9FUNG|nr:hypothetical protein BB561_002210 [Smittium simulii]